MRTKIQPIWRTVAAICALLVLMTGRALAGTADVISVAALPYNDGSYRISVVFPVVVERTRGRAEMVELWQRSGWTPTAVEWIRTPALKGFPSQTSVEFTVSTLFPKGELPVEAMALAFRRWGGVDVTVAHNGLFNYGGKPHYENSDAAMDVTTGTNALNIVIRIKNPNITSLRFTTLSRAAPPGSTPARQKRRGLPVWAVVLLALPVAALTGGVVYRAMLGKRADGR